ncbi:MAG: DUF6703 family protein [Mycobacteriales bacterium]
MPGAVVQADEVSAFRRTVEKQAGPVLVLLSRAPRWVPFAVVLGCVVGGLLLQGPVAAVLLGVVLALLGLQLFFAWPVIEPPQRVLRFVVLALLTAAVLARL